MPFNTIDEAINDISEGKIVIVVDDEDRENEGDFLMAAEKVTAEKINFMARYGRGLICMPCVKERIDKLKIPLMVTNNTSSFNTAFTVSVGVKDKITTGISAHDRAATIKSLISPETEPADIVMPGHVFPLIARQGGVLERAGHTEAAVDLAKIAGLFPAGVICEIMNEDGTMARIPELKKIARKFKLKMITVADLIHYRRLTEKLVEKTAETVLPTESGVFKAIGYRYLLDGSSHVALVKGEVKGKKNVLVRVHSECLTGDVFRSLRCDCGKQIEKSLEMIEEEGNGVLLYMMGHEGRGIGILNKLRAYRLQDEGKDTVEANEALGFPPDLRDYGVGAQILVDLGVTSMRLITNNPYKIVGLKGYGLKVESRVPLLIAPTAENRKYLETKKKKLKHIMK